MKETSGAAGGNPAITVGIPFFNPGKHFDLALRSVFAQSVRDWELILVDDGSTDGALELARSVCDNRVRVLSDGMNRGLSCRLNEISRLARGRYLVRMDADDVMHPRRLEVLLRALDGVDESTVVGSCAYSIDSESRVVGLRDGDVFRGRTRSFIHPTVAAHRSWFLKHPYSEAHEFLRSEDYELWCRTEGDSLFITLPDRLLFYRESGSFSLSRYYQSEIGILCVLVRRRDNWLRFLSRVSARLARLWVASALHSAGRGELMVRWRIRPVADGERIQAEAAIEEIRQARWLGQPDDAPGCEPL